MKNLKRLLSLALTGVMLSGMMVMGASAAEYTDAESIEHTEAVEIMSSLNIINGKPDGSYDPEGLVSRAEMAKMIAVAMNGGKETTYGTKTTPTYTDIKGHWAEQYIEYCSDLKIISGRGNGIFDPEGKVTGTEAAKMLLSALGYDATAYRLTGADWDTNVNYEATQTADPKLYEELDGVVVANPVTRDAAAQIIWNGLQNVTRTKTPDKSVNTGEVTYTYTPSGKTLLKAQYDADIFVGTFNGNDKFNNNGSPKTGEIVVSGRLDGESALTASGAANPVRHANFPAEFDIANIGEQVKVIYKEGKGGRSSTPDKADKIYGVFLTGVAQTVTSTVDKVANFANKGEQTIKVDGTVYDLANTVTVYRNFDKTNQKSTFNVSQLTDGTSKVASTLTQALRTPTGSDVANNGASGDFIKLVMDANDDVDTIYIIESKIAVVTAKNSTKVTLNNGVGSVTFEDNDIYEDIAVDDVVVVTTLYNNAANKTGAVTTIEKAESVTGTLDSYKYSYNSGDADDSKIKACESLKLDGETYKIYGTTKDMLDDDLDDLVDIFGKTMLDEEFELYLINGYVAAARQLTKGNSNYSLVIEKSAAGAAGGAINGLKIRVMGSDGVKTVLTVSENSYKKGANTDANKIVNEDDIDLLDIVTYSVSKDGTADVKIEGKAAAKDTKNTEYHKSTKKLTHDSADMAVADDCVLYANVNPAMDKDGVTPLAPSYKAFNLRDLKNIPDAQYAFNIVSNADNEAVAVYLDLGFRPGGATNSRVYGIISGYEGRLNNEDGVYYRYTVDVNDEQYTIDWKSGTRVATGSIVSFEPTNDNMYATGDVANISAGTYSIDGDTAVVGFVEKYSSKDNTITIVTSVDPVTDGNGNVVRYDADTATRAIYAIDDKANIYFVDRDEKVGTSGSISKYDVITGTKNVILMVNGTGDVTNIIFETSNKTGF